MNKRLFDLLQFIFNSNEVITVEDISNHFNVLVRTVNKYLKSLISYLSETGYPDIVQVKNSRIIVKADDKLKEEIIDSVNILDYYNYKLTTAERQFIISLMLLQSKGPITIANFESVLSVSKGTIIKDLYEISQFFKCKNIVFGTYKRYGILIDATESERINTIFELIRVYELDFKMIAVGKKNVLISYLRNSFNIDGSIARVENAIKLVENHFKLSILDSDYYRTLVFVCILLSEITSGSNIELSYPRNTDPDREASETVALYLLSLLLRDRPSLSDIYFLADHLFQYFMSDSRRDSMEQPIDYYIVVKSFLYKLSTVYNIDLITDNNLQDFLTTHILYICERQRRGEKISNPFKSDLMMQYYNDYKIIRENCYFLEEHLHIEFDDDDLSYILMHIVAALERRNVNNKTPNVIIAHNVGYSIADLMVERLKKRCSINIKGVVPTHQIREALENNDIDFVISTDNLLDYEGNLVVISPLALQNDIDRINQIVNSLMEEKANARKDGQDNSQRPLTKMFEEIGNPNKNNRKKKIIDESLIVLDSDACDWRDAILMSGEPLLWNKYIKPEYMIAMVNIVANHGSYIVFVPNVAFAHAYPGDGAIKNGFSFLRLKKPVKFGNTANDPVKIILAFSLVNTRKYVNVITRVMNMMCDETIKKRLLEAETAQQVADILNNNGW